jgi:4-hydroxy-tetrahydrodipicolinate synthase
LLTEYQKAGCRNVLFQIPYRDNRQFMDHFMELASCDPEMIMLQDWDSSGYGLPDELICELFDSVEAFRCLKIETVPAGVKYSRILNLTGGRLNISGGWAVSQMIEGMRRGVHAFMPTGMHYIYTHIYRLFADGQQDEAQQYFYRILPVLAFSNQHLDISIHFFKQLLFRQGLYPTPNVRIKTHLFDDLHREIADQHIDYIILLENSLKSNAY